MKALPSVLLPRRAIVAAACALAGAIALPAVAQGQASWPSHPVRLVVPFPASGATDLVARVVAQRMSQDLGQQLVIDNRPGAGGTIGTGEAAKASPDGYTLLFTTSSTHAISPHLMTRLAYKADKDFTPIAEIGGAASILLVTPSLPVRNVQELIAYAKAHPGKVNFGSSGNGSSIHLSGELFKSLAKVDMVHVPYKGSAPAVTDLLGNQIAIMFDNLPSAIQYVRAGRLRPIALTTAKRSPELPDVPTIAEAGLPGYEATSWFGLLAPAKTPADIVNRIDAALVKVLANPEVKKKLSEQGAEPYAETPEQFAAFIKAETAKWASVVKESGASLD